MNKIILTSLLTLLALYILMAVVPDLINAKSDIETMGGIGLFIGVILAYIKGASMIWAPKPKNKK